MELSRQTSEAPISFFFFPFIPVKHCLDFDARAVINIVSSRARKLLSQSDSAEKIRKARVGAKVVHCGIHAEILHLQITL